MLNRAMFFYVFIDIFSAYMINKMFYIRYQLLKLHII